MCDSMCVRWEPGHPAPRSDDRAALALGIAVGGDGSLALEGRTCLFLDLGAHFMVFVCGNY